MVTSDPMTLSRSGFVRRIRSSFWTSRLSAALGEQFADHANMLISGVGFCHTGIRAVRYSGLQLPTTHPMRCSTCFVALRQSVGSSRTQPLLREMSGNGTDRLSSTCVKLCQNEAHEPTDYSHIAWRRNRSYSVVTTITTIQSERRC